MARKKTNDSMIDQRSLNLVVLLAILVIAIAVIYWRQGIYISSLAPMPIAQMNQMMSLSRLPAPTSQISLHMGLTYSEALNTYKNRVLINGCRGTVGVQDSNTLSVKKGTAFLLDNRDTRGHMMMFGGQSVQVGAQDFAIISPQRTGVYPLTCDGRDAMNFNIGQ